jgi:alpha-beta hydrolase superfamily lysophospholipase
MILEKKAGRHTLFLEAKEVGNDLLVNIYGGDEYHIGGVAIAYETKSHYRDASTVSVSTLTFPGHKDYIVANSAAERICAALEKSTVVTTGIHYEKATKAEIETIIKATEWLVNELISHYQKAE